jgi:hypothetical protein
MTLEERLNKAFKDLRRQGIVVKRNVASCCQSCANLDLADEVPVLWSFGGQGNRNVVSGDDYDYSDWGFNHGNLVSAEGLTDSGKRVLATLEANGIVVEWEDDQELRPYRKITLDLEKSVNHANA